MIGLGSACRCTSRIMGCIAALVSGSLNPLVAAEAEERPTVARGRAITGEMKCRNI